MRPRFIFQGSFDPDSGSLLGFTHPLVVASLWRVLTTTFMKIHIVRKFIVPTAKVLTATAAVATLSACASLESFSAQKDSPLPIEAVHSNTGAVLSTRAYETSDKLYVAGSARKRPLKAGGHVDIQLIGSNGNVIAEKKDSINAMHPRPGGGKRSSDSYVANFPLSEASEAVKIRVTFHSGSHS